MATLNAADEPIESVDLNHIIKSIQDDLDMVIQQKSARIVYHDLPVIDGAAILIHQLFYNLISNSLKFSRREVTPTINITAARIREGGQDFTELTVRDNGIGFDQEHATKIFDSFSRLNSKDRFEGTGLGLSLSKKIVERHGGSISAIGTPDQGACIIIKLPCYKK